jgi:hypothetical protein
MLARDSDCDSDVGRTTRRHLTIGLTLISFTVLGTDGRVHHPSIPKPSSQDLPNATQQASAIYGTACRMSLGRTIHGPLQPPCISSEAES